MFYCSFACRRPFCFYKYNVGVGCDSSDVPRLQWGRVRERKRGRVREGVHVLREYTLKTSDKVGDPDQKDRNIQLDMAAHLESMEIPLARLLSAINNRLDFWTTGMGCLDLTCLLKPQNSKLFSLSFASLFWFSCWLVIVSCWLTRG